MFVCIYTVQKCMYNIYMCITHRYITCNLFIAYKLNQMEIIQI